MKSGEKMDKKYSWVYYVWMYFDILKKLNINYASLNKLDGLENNRKRELLYYDIVEEITQIIPYKIYKGKLHIRKQEGILELLNYDNNFVEKEFKKMLSIYREELSSIKQIRNNVEHSPHRILILSQLTSQGNSSVTINYYKKGTDLNEITVDSIECCHCDSDILGKIITELNVIFKQIRKEINFLSKSGKIDKNLMKHYSKYKLKIVSGDNSGGM